MRAGKTFSFYSERFLLKCCVVVCIVCFVFYVLFVCKCVLPPGDNPIAVNKYINISMVANFQVKYFVRVNSCSVQIARRCLNYTSNNFCEDSYIPMAMNHIMSAI